MTGENESPPTWPSVAVVVPTRDRPQQLRTALEAVEQQDYPGAVHALVVFDRTTPDASLGCAGAQRSVEVLVNGRSPGLAGSRNTGILAAGTDLVAFCDDDDVWHPGRLRHQVEALRALPDAVMATTGIRVVYEDRVMERRLAQPAVELADLLRSRLTELHPSTFLMARSALMDRIGLVDEEIPGSYAEDYEFLLRAARVHAIVNVPEPLVDVHWHAKSFFAGRWETISTALRWLLQRYPEFQQEPRGQARILGQIAFADAASGRRGDAVRGAAATLRLRPREARALLALAVASGLVTPERVLRVLHRHGRGL